MEKRLTVMCVLWQGFFSKTVYSAEWVEKLRNMVARCLALPYEFVCLSNDHLWLQGVRHVLLERNWPGWWSKIEAFRPDLPEGRTLYLDLDTLIIRDLQPIVEFPADFAIGPPYGRPDRHKRKKITGVERGYNSSVMVFDRGDTTRAIWDQFNRNPRKWMKNFRGDQDFLHKFFPDLDILPVKWIPKLGGCIDGNGEFAPSKHAKVVLCMPYKNDVAVEKYAFVKELWQ